MSIKKYLLFASLLVTQITLFGQKIWTLEECVNRAIEKSFQVEGSKISLQNTEVSTRQAQHARYPNLSGGTNVGWNFGRTIDPTRNEFVTETFFNNGFTLSSNVTLYNGGRINNSIKQTDADNKASLKDLEQSKRDISLTVSSIYLNILFAKENFQNASKQLAQTKEQLSLLNRQIAVGNRPENDRLDIEAQIAQNEQTLTEAQNNLNIQLLNLKQSLRLDISENIDIASPPNIRIDTDPEIVTFEELYAAALRNQSSVHAEEMRVKSAYLGEKIAAADLLPSIGAGGSLRTNYSNKGFDKVVTGQTYFDRTLLLNNQPITVGFPIEEFELNKTPYFDQFTDNLSYGVGVSMNIPIYNNLVNRSNVQRAKLNTSRAELVSEQVKETLKITVGQAHADAKAAKARFLATEKTKNAQNNVYNNAVKRFENGSTNVFELSRLKTLFDTAETNHLIAKYDYLFRTKVLDFYLGKPIQLN